MLATQYPNTFMHCNNPAAGRSGGRNRPQIRKSDASVEPPKCLLGGASRSKSAGTANSPIEHHLINLDSIWPKTDLWAFRTACQGSMLAFLKIRPVLGMLR